MARKLRVQYADALYHILSRGDRREPIFRDDKDRVEFLTTLGQACAKTGWKVHAYCLMSNHFHLVIETPQANLVDGMKWFLGTYTSRFNRRHRLSGHLFSGRYKALLVDGSGSGYLRTVCDYVHLNPVRAKLVGAGQPLRQQRWSSYGLYLAPPTQRPPWLSVDRLFGELGVPKDSTAGRRQFERVMEERRRIDEPEGFNSIRSGWCLGDEEFRQELLAQMDGRMGRHHGGPERQQNAESQARRILAEELKRRRWRPASLSGRLKSDPEKVRIATRLRQETTMTWDWIAGQLWMGTGGSAANAVRSAIAKA